MSRGGARTEAEDPERKCIVSGESQPKGGLIRFVLGPEDQLVPDVAAKLPGRGIYVAADRAALQKAMKKNLFGRAARRPVSVPEGLDDLVEQLVLRRVIDAMSMARKAGQAVTGLEKVKEWLVNGKARVLVQASDGSEREKARLRAPAGGHVTCLTAGEIGLAFGRERAIHAALGAGGLGLRVVEEAARLAGLRPELGAPGPDGGVTALKD
jgi:uncharacterized protein